MKDTDSIFLVNSEGELERVPHQRYQNEDLLQGIVDKYPELIVGEQINPDDPPRWIVIQREAAIPGSEEQNGRWSIDHLFLDQHGRPTFVEVKRSSDSRIRREVVGQMLDYAANALKYWPPDQIRTLAAEKFGSLEALETTLQNFLGWHESSDPSQDLEAYWATVEQNLRNGQVRLLFVADEIPAELRSIIEFLNEHMPMVEVLGVEIKQYQNQGIQALVPRIFGQTEYARQQKRTPGGTPKKTTKEDFLTACPEHTRRFFERLFSEAQDRDFTLYWGTKGFSVRRAMTNGQYATFFYGYPPGAVSSNYTEPVFQAYLGGYIKDTKARDDLQKAFLHHIPFEQRGQHTLEIRLDGEGLRKADAGLSEVMNIAQKFADEGRP